MAADTKLPDWLRQQLPTRMGAAAGPAQGHVMERSAPSLLLPTRGLSMYDTQINVKKLSRVVSKQVRAVSTCLDYTCVSTYASQAIVLVCCAAAPKVYRYALQTHTRCHLVPQTA